MTTTTRSSRAGWARWFWACLLHEVNQRWGGGRLKDSQALTEELVARMAQVEADVMFASLRAVRTADLVERRARAIELDPRAGDIARRLIRTA